MMRGHMTTGTFSFLKSFTTKNKHIDFFFMNSGSNTLIYYESEQNEKKIFTSGQSYEVVISDGELKQEGYVVMHHIPISDESMPLFENHLRNKSNIRQTVTDIHALRLLKPLKGNTYIILTYWPNQKIYELWKDTDVYEQLVTNNSVRSPGYYTDETFITSGAMIDKDLL
ncbi:MAG TPA: antibiotic biosynthesis monooxygenase [Bacillota bacterium]|nr:antibiotic biosynthesis monooxygenase [Bacillota bacterium]